MKRKLMTLVIISIFVLGLSTVAYAGIGIEEPVVVRPHSITIDN